MQFFLTYCATVPMGGALCNDDRCLSVRLSVCPVSDAKSRTEGRSKLKIGRREAIYRSKGQRSRSLGRLMLRWKMRHNFGTKRSTHFKLGVLMERDDSHHRHAQWPQRSKIVTSRRQFDACLHNSTKKSRVSTKIGTKVVYATGDIAYQFQGQTVKGHGHQTDRWSG